MGRIALLAAVIASVIPAPSQGATPAGIAEPYGLLSASDNFLPGDTPAARIANYRRLYDAGVRAIRMDVLWTTADPPGSPLRQYDFSAIDRHVEDITAAGLKVIAILDY